MRDSVKFCHEVGMNYVSASPFRVPIARLAAAQAVIEAEEAQEKEVAGRMSRQFRCISARVPIGPSWRSLLFATNGGRNPRTQPTAARHRDLRRHGIGQDHHHAPHH